VPNGASFERRTRARLPTENVFTLRALLGLFTRAARARFFQPPRGPSASYLSRAVRRAHSLGNPIQDAYFFAPRNWHDLDLADLDLGGTSAIPVNVPVVARVLAMDKDGNA